MEHRILDEDARLQGLRPGPRERFIREQIGISPTRYYQIRNALLDSPAALRYAPLLINRLNRQREANRRKYW
ncbi:DUF3263 domain-containing protein [Streptomyces sp. MS1.AVA.3]